MKYSKLVIAIISVLLIVAISFVFIKQFANQANLEDSAIKIALDNELATLNYEGYTFENELVETEKGIESEDTTYTYDLYERKSLMGKLTVTIRKINNGDQFVFSKFENFSEKEITLPASVVLQDTYSYAFHNFVDKEPEREHDRVFGMDYTTNVKGL